MASSLRFSPWRRGRDATARPADHAALGPRPARNLENPWMAQKTPFRQISCLKNPFLLNGAKCALQIFSKTFLGRFGGFQWVGAKKSWKAFLSIFETARNVDRRPTRAIARASNYNRDSAFGEEIVRTFRVLAGIIGKTCEKSLTPRRHAARSPSTRHSAGKLRDKYDRPRGAMAGPSLRSGPTGDC